MTILRAITRLMAVIFIFWLVLFLMHTYQVKAGECAWNPPKHFDYVPTKPFKVIKRSKEQINTLCKQKLDSFGADYSTNGYYGCTINYDQRSVIYIIAGGDGCVTEENILRHEYGHVNNWNSQHSN